MFACVSNVLVLRCFVCLFVLLCVCVRCFVVRVGLVCVVVC